MTTKKVAELLETSENNVRKYKGVFRYHRGYFYRHGQSEKDLENHVKSKIPLATILDSGDHWHAFVGGAKSGSAQDSFLWVRFTA